MTTLEALFASPFTWMIFGAAAQLSLAGYARSPRTYLWVLAPLVTIVCLLAAVPTARSGSPDAYQIAMGYGLISAAMMIAVSAPAAMNEGILLAVTTTYWMSFLLSGPATWWRGFAFGPAAFVASVPTVAVLLIAALGLRPAPWARFALYLWALFALVVVGVMRFPLHDFTALQAQGRGWVVVLAATYLGAHVAMLAHNAMSLVALVPIQTENQTFGARMRQVEDFAAKLAACYSPEPVGRVNAVLIVLGQGVFIWLLNLWRPQGGAIGVHAGLSLVLISTIFFTRPPDTGPQVLPTGGDLKREMRRRRRP